MKISPRSKRSIAPHPQVAALIADLLATPTENLTQFLSSIDTWRWPRSDLNAWIKVLDKFDTILEDVIREHDVDNLQVKDFTSETKKLLCEILKFERLLLENSTNRKLFHSYDRLNSLLLSSDLDILVATLLLLLRPSQQYSGQQGLAQLLHLSTARLESLAKSWPSLREHGIDMVDLVCDKSDKHVERLPQEASEVNLTFYRTGESHLEKDKDDTAMKVDSSRPQAAAQSSSSVTVHLGPLAQSSRTASEIFIDAVKSNDVPNGEKFELLCRIRTARALGIGRQEERRKLVIARLLAIAIYGHTHVETQAQNSIFLYEPDLVTRIAEILQQDRGIPTLEQTAALSSLDALTRYRGKLHEVLAAVNAGVNHGIIMSLLRKTVADISNAGSTLPNIFVDALLSFIALITSHATGGSLIVGAGLIPLVIQIISINFPERVSIVSKTMTLVDNVLLAYSNAFTMFCNGRGVDVLTERIMHEVDLAVELHSKDEKAQVATNSYGLLQFARAGVLKHILRSMHRMMQSSGTAEGMRGLIDSSLLKSVEKIIIYRGVFGPTVLPLAINIVATFLHNEPTSFSAIQEAKMPETIYEAFEFGVEPSIEVIQAFTNVIGALCLNQAGQVQLASRPSIIPSLFHVFTSERHLKTLQEKGNAVLIGTSVDELIRHHPSLKESVFQSVVSTLEKVDALGRTYRPVSSNDSWYMLSHVSPSANSDDVSMEDVRAVIEPPMDGETPTVNDESAVQGEEASDRAHDNIIISFIDVVSKFLEGLFHQVPAHCEDFVEVGGLTRLTNLLTLPSLPYDFASPPHIEPIAQVIRIMTEVCPGKVLQHITKEVQQSLEETRDFWQNLPEKSRLLPFVEPSCDDDLTNANVTFRKLVTLHSRVMLLSEVYTTTGFAHGRSAMGVLHELSGPGAIDIIPSLGALHRAFIWENILFKSELRSKGIKSSASGEQTPKEGPLASPFTLLTENGEEHVLEGSSSAEGPGDQDKKSPVLAKENERDLNARALAYIASQTPKALLPVFSALAKMLVYGRRVPDPSQKKQAAAVSAALASVFHKHLAEFSYVEGPTVYAYHTLMLSLITVMLFDENSPQNNLHVFLLVQFRKCGGLDAVIKTSRLYTEAISRISDIKPVDQSESDKQELVHAYGGFKVALHLLYSLISFKPTVDISQVASFVSRDKPESHPDFFEPHDFLVKLRIAIAPAILEVWRAPWLISAPPAISRYALTSVKEIVVGENERAVEGGHEVAAAAAAISGFPRPAAPTEDQIRQISDMGFPVAAARRALERARNNVQLATEFLINNPFAAALEEVNEPVAPTDADMASVTVGDALPQEAEATVQDPLSSSEAHDTPSQAEQPNEPSYNEKTVEERRNDLDNLRKEFTTDIGSSALRLVDAHPTELIFDVRQLFIGPADSYRAEAFMCLIDDIEKFSPSAFDVQEQPLSIRCRLLALILTADVKMALEVAKDKGWNIMNILQALLLSHPIGVDKDQHLPKWLASLFLATESLFIASGDIRPVKLPAADETVEAEELLTGPSYKEARATVFDVCMRMLDISPIPRNELLALLSMLVQLTRVRETAKRFIEEDGVAKLMKIVKGSFGEASTSVGFQSHVAIIFRHLIEDKELVESFLRQEIKRWFSFPRNRIVDVTTFVRSCSAMVIRDPETFLDVTKSLCQLTQADSTVPTLMLRPDQKDENSSKPGSASDAKVEEHISIDVKMTDTKSDTVNLTLEGIVHFMMDELIRASKAPPGEVDSQDTIAGSSTAQPSSESIQSGAAQRTSSPSSDQHSYVCLMMSYLAELLVSYDDCKSALISYPKKKGPQTPAKEGGRSKSVALSFFLTEFVSYGHYNADPKFDAQKRLALCNSAIQVIVGLCMDNASTHVDTSAKVDFASIRKLVLEGLSKSIKEASSIESADERYARLCALCELCHSLLTVRFTPGQSKSTEEACMQIAKIMLEKNYVSTLTSALSDVDLKYPNIKSLVSTVLRPLEHLTKVAIKMNRASDKGKVPSDKESDISESLPSEDEDESMDAMNNREETPDLYRNSALGMYAGEMEDVNYDMDEEMDEDEDEDDDDIDVDYDEGTASDDTSNTDENEDIVEGEDLALTVAAEPVDGWHDEDEEMEDEEGDEDDEDTDGDPEEDDGDDDEMMWQDVGGPDGNIAGVVGGNADDDDDADDDALDAMEQAADDVEQEVLSEQDIADDLGELEDAGLGIHDFDDGFDYGRHSLRGLANRRGLVFGGGMISGHSRADNHDLQIFGRTRPANAESASHPLLVDDSGTNTSGSNQPRNIQRRLQRGILPGNSFSDMLQTIESLVGGGAVQLMQRLAANAGMGGAISADIHVEVPQAGGAAGLLVDERPRHGRGTMTASVRLRDPRSADGRAADAGLSTPMLTIQRWTEEANVTLQKHLQERIMRMCNHISRSLLPEAREVAMQAKEIAEREAAEKEAAMKEATENRKKAEEEIEAAEGQEATEEPGVQQSTSSLSIAMTDSNTEQQQQQPPSAQTEDAAMFDIRAGVEGDPVSQVDTAAVTADVTMSEGAPMDEGLHQSSSNGTENQVDAPDEASTSSAVVERITITIHGNPVDITDTGIDPTFLEALPDDMREEIVNQHFREQRSARVEQAVDSQISPEFLEALPPDIRAEILQQERLEMARRQGQAAQGANAVAPGPAEIDPASFIASLDPQLRQSVLLESDDGFLQTLPSHMIAEAGVYLDMANQLQARREIAQPRSTPAAAPAPRKVPQIRDAVQLLDKSGVASIVRLLFFPQLSRRNTLLKVLVNLCENSKSRTDLFNLILSILQDGTGDVASVDKNFAQLSFRTSKVGPQTPKSSQKQKEPSTLLSSSSAHLPSEIAPDLIAQRCLDALSYIVDTNQLSSLFFLTEHELPAGLRRNVSRKGKGKEKQAPQSHYPIVLLLGLLDRQTLLKAPSIVDAVAGLLDTITKPLTSLKPTEKKPDELTTEPSGSVQSVSETNTAGVVDTNGAVAQSASVAEAPAVQAVQTSEQEKSESLGTVEERILLANPPQIPHPALRLIVNILTVGECSGKTFQHTLSLISHLSFLPDARDIIGQELKIKAQEFGQNISNDLDGLIAALRNHSEQEGLPSSLASKFSPASSDQAKLLRILKTIDYMYAKAPTSQAPSDSTHADRAKEIYESFRFTLLWRKLGDCLTVIEDKPNVEHIATILLPLIESLMVVCKNVGLKVSPTRLSVAPGSPRSPTTAEESIDTLFVSFTDEHRKVLNLMVRNNPSLMSGSFSLLVQNSRVLDFDNKRNYFSQQLHRRPHSREHHGPLSLNIRRARVFEDSYHAFLHKSGDAIKYGKLSVRFYAEEGVDAGGVTREWFQILARQMFNLDYALFEPCAADRQTYQPNKASQINPDHLHYFKFVGRVIGKAIYDGRLMDAHFARSLYRQLLGKPVDYKDVEWVDPEYYNSLCWILENDPSLLDLTFIAEVDEFGMRKVVPLKENGASIPVTLENRKEYVQLSAQYRLYSSIQEQIEHLLSGFYEIIPKELISIFNEQEVELLISGTPDIDVDEWRAATEYTGYSSSDPVIVWWWRALKSFNRDEKAKVLSFATGTSRVPLGGFVDLQGVQGVQRFSIHKAYGEQDRLPQAHTCFNQIDLPQYSSYEKLRQQLLLAINEGGEGFGFA